MWATWPTMPAPTNPTPRGFTSAALEDRVQGRQVLGAGLVLALQPGVARQGLPESVLGEDSGHRHVGRRLGVQLHEDAAHAARADRLHRARDDARLETVDVELDVGRRGQPVPAHQLVHRGAEEKLLEALVLLVALRRLEA